MVVVVVVVVVYLSIYLSICKFENEAFLRDFLNFSKLTASKTKQFCESFFKNGKLSAELTASCRCVLRFAIPSV